MQIKRHDKSHIVVLSDGSAWRIWPGDISETLRWQPTTERPRTLHHNSLLASFAPATSASSLAHMIEG